MDINTLRKWIAERDTYSILETVDVHTGEQTVGKSCCRRRRRTEQTYLTSF